MNAVLQPPPSGPTQSDVNEIFRERARRLSWLRQSEGRVRSLRKYYRAHIPDMVNDWGVTIDPRNAGTHVPVVLPFTLDKRQREWLEFAVDCWRSNEYGLTEKSRDVGLSWLIVGFTISLCDLFDDIAIGWGSYKKEKLDFRGDLGSLFEKGRTYLQYLPWEFRGGHNPAWHSFERRMLFPRTRASVIGEVGDNCGRGGRTSLYLVDEAAHYEHDQLVDAALSKTTKVRLDVSSVCGMTNTFAQRAHKKGIRKFTYHWRDNPRFTQKDYEKFLETWGPVITAQELDINYQASLEGVVLPALWVNAAVDADEKLKEHPTQPLKSNGGEWLAALDVADQGIDKNAAGVRHGVKLVHVEQWAGKDSDLFATTERAFTVCDLHGAVRKLRYDSDGLGAGIRGDARKVNERRNPAHVITVEAFRGSAEVIDPLKEMIEGRKNEDFLLNRKSQGWIWLRVLFQNTYRAVQGEPYDPERIIVINGKIPDIAKLLIELSQPTYTQNQAGKIVIDKQPDGTPSPNLADVVMMLYAPGRRAMKIDDSLLGGDPLPEF